MTPDDLKAEGESLLEKADQLKEAADLLERHGKDVRELRADAEATRQDALKVIRLAEALLRTARHLRTHAGESQSDMRVQDSDGTTYDVDLKTYRGKAPGLPVVSRSRTVVRMEPATKELKISKARATEHPFPEALRQRGLTIGEWADTVGLTRARVSSWLRAEDGRRIPLEWAERIRDEFGVSLDSWPHGVKQ